MDIPLPDVLFKLDFWNLIIALLALILAIYSIWYTRRKDRYSIEVIEAEYFQNDSDPYLIFFKVFNTSNAPITITDIQLLDFHEHIVETLDFEPGSNSKFPYGPIDIPANWRYQKPFTDSKIIPSENYAEFSYYLNPLVSPMIIKVSTNHNIQWFSKTKLFKVKFSKFM
ncbi:hypothetical protein AAK938_01460 [Aerococcaceae bacterium 50-4]